MSPGEFIHVQAAFKAPDGESEWMWVEITSWHGDKIKGLLRNEPYKITTLHGGQVVQVHEADVFDYIHRRADGIEDGNETGKIIEKSSAAGKGKSSQRGQ
jgi:uncharacterized protein YegJ (DUF2314 family)